MAKDRKSKKGQEEGGEEEVKVQPGKETVNDDTGPAKQGGKKGKKNRKKDDWEDDVANELAALSLETKGVKKAQDVEEDSLPEMKHKEKTRGKADPSQENTSEESFKGKSFKKQKAKKGKAGSDDEETSVVKGGKKDSTISISDDEATGFKDTKKTKGKKGALRDSDDEDSIMQKKGKNKKKGKGFESDDESIDLGKNQKSKKKGPKGKDISDEEIDIVNDSKSSKQRGKKTQVVLSDDDDEPNTDHIGSKQKQKKGKGGSYSEGTGVSEVSTAKKSKGKKNKNVDSDDELEESAQKSKASREVKTSKPKSGFQLLMDDMDIDIDELSDESPVEVQTKQGKQPEKEKPKDEEEEMDVVDGALGESKKEVKSGKKSKKKDRKRKGDEEEEDVDKILEELALEMEGKKLQEKPKEECKEVDKDISIAEDSKPSETDEQTKKKKKKKKGDSEVSTVERPADDQEPSPDATGEDSTVKTAAQKKKEKKEREKQKKLIQNEQERAKSAKDDSSKEQKGVAAETSMPKEEESQAVDDDKVDEDEADDKKKKKKKKGEKEDKKEKKGPGKKMIAAMQEALKKVKEEEERLKREEEERQRAAEEAERLRLEKLRLEQERKERKKQKEKEKRERLKAEGKLLSKTQRQARARMEATLAALRQQGVEVPQIGEKVAEKKPRLGDRKRTPKKKEEEKQDSPEVKVEIVVEPQKPEEPVPLDNKEPVSEDWEADDVKDAWDETTDEEPEDEQEEEEETPVRAEIPKAEKPAVQPPLKKQESVEESDESTESEESSEEEESESEEESSDESEDEGKTQEEKVKERAIERIRKRREEAEKNRSVNKLRSPVVCVLGHVDTGKTSLLDKIRRTHVQGSEAGGITQQIGATMVPQEALKEKCKMAKSFSDLELKIPGLLIIDTPGHESFSNLRSRGSSLCDIAVLVVDIMHGLEQQTIESINLLKMKKTPFIVALNKIDRVYEWKPGKHKDVQDVIKSQGRNTRMDFEKRTKEIIVQFAEQSLNAALYYENPDPRSWISMVPTSAHTGDGMGNLLALVVELTQTMMAKRISFTEDLQATVLEVKAIPGLGTTIDVILVNGRLREGDTIILAGHEGAMVTQIRALLMPQPLKELRVKNPYEEFKEVEGAQGVKIAGKDLDKAIAGLQLLVAHHPDEVELLKEEVNKSLQDAMNAIKLAERGVYVQASTLGSLEALLEFLKVSKVPYSGVRIGPVVKKDVMKASIMLEHDSQYAVILAFDVKIERDAQELADSLGVKIFQADIIYHLFQRLTDYRVELMHKKREEFKNIAVFPCKLRILPQFIFNSRDPIVVGVVVEAGIVKEGTPLCVPSKEFLDIGTVSTIEINHKAIQFARKGQEVCIKIEPNGGEAPKMFGRHFDHTDWLVSKISRQSIDACKEYFRDELQKTDWQLMVELKKTFQIL